MTPSGIFAERTATQKLRPSGIPPPSISRHLSVLRQAGLITERRDANRILYSLVGERLALSVGDFLSTVCPEQIVLREVRKRATPLDREAEATQTS